MSVVSSKPYARQIEWRDFLISRLIIRCAVDVGKRHVRHAVSTQIQRSIEKIHYQEKTSVAHLEHRTLFREAIALVVEASGGNIGVAEHLLDFREIRAVFEGVGGRRGPQTMRPDWKAEGGGIFAYQLIHAVRRHAVFGIAATIVQGVKERTRLILAVASFSTNES
jgi:hypothetical protein